MSTFEAYRLPVEAEWSPVPMPMGAGATDPDHDGGTLLRAELSSDGASHLIDALVDSREALRARTNREITDVLGRAAERFLDPADPLRLEALEWLAPEAALSPPMARLLIDRMASDWTTEALRRMLSAELPDPAVLERFGPGPEGDRVRASGDRFAFHVGAGNVAGVGATSMLRSLLVRTPLLLKPGRGDVVLPVLLARAIGDEDSELGRSVAVVYWPGGSRPPLEDEALRRAERVVVYGGAAAVEDLRARAPSSTPLVAYRHRVSAGAIGRERLGSEDDARRLAAAAAEAVAAYDQRGCVSPHVLWVERGAEIGPEDWAALLAEAMSEVGERLPPGRPEPGTAARIQQLRATAEMKAALGGGQRVFASEGVAWSVLFEPEAAFEPGCAGRLVRVRALDRLEALPEILAPWREVLQSVSLEARPERRAGIAEGLAEAGVSRVTTLDRQAWPRPWWMHDGQGPLRVLLRWTTLEAE